MTYWFKVYAMVTILVFLTTSALLFAAIAVRQITGLISKAFQAKPYIGNPAVALMKTSTKETSNESVHNMRDRIGVAVLATEWPTVGGATKG
jgi:hypothetical protein